MMKNFTQKLYAALLTLTCLAFCSSMTAQTPFWTEDFSDSLSLGTTWTTGGTNTGMEDWTWSDDPTGIFNGQPDFGATTASNGFVQFNADANGEGNSFDWMLTSSSIDVSAQDQVFLTFETQFAYFYDLGASVGVSTDGGQVYTYYPVLQDVASNDLSMDVRTVILELPEAGAADSIQIQFRWQAQWEYVWRIDDINLVDSDPTPSYDFGLRDYFYPPRSFATPMQMIDFDTMGFSADLTNLGSSPVPSVVLGANVTDEPGNILWADSILIDELPVGTTDSTFAIESQFIPGDMELGLYNINYWTYSSDPSVDDQSTNDNTSNEQFLVTEADGGLWSKDNATTTFFRPGGGPIDYIAANLYETSPNIVSGQYFATDVTLSAAKNAADGNLEGDIVNLLLLKIKDEEVDPAWDTFDAMADVFTNPGFEIKSFTPYTFTTAGTQGVETGQLLDLDQGTPGVALDSGTRYFLCASYEGASNVIFQGFSQDIDYFQISTIIYSSQWFLGGFGPENAATLRMGVTLGTTTDETPLPAESMSIYPNPTSDVLSMDVSLENAVKANIVIADLSGKIIQLHEYGSLKSDNFQFDVSDLPNGMYLARLATEEGTRTMKFVVQK